MDEQPSLDLPGQSKKQNAPVFKPYRGKYVPRRQEPYYISRSKIDLFLECGRCFYFDRRLGIGRPPGFPFNLNSAVDTLLKKEFDIHRAKGEVHPLMAKYNIDAIPIPHEKLNAWRENFVGIQFLHKDTNLMITGAIDDLWQSPKGEYIVVDYKATSKQGEVSLDAEWQISYKRQMEMYQWLLRQNGLKVSNTGYFVYCNGRTDLEAFDGKLEFDIKVIPYTGDDSWLEETLAKLHDCLNQNKPPASNPSCDYCSYYNKRAEHEAMLSN